MGHVDGNTRVIWNNDHLFPRTGTTNMISHALTLGSVEQNELKKTLIAELCNTVVMITGEIYPDL